MGVGCDCEMLGESRQQTKMVLLAQTVSYFESCRCSANKARVTPVHTGSPNFANSTGAHNFAVLELHSALS